MGAIVKAFDTREAAREQVQSLGGEFIDINFIEEGKGQGGYGKVMSESYYSAQRQMVNNKLIKKILNYFIYYKDK